MDEQTAKAFEAEDGGDWTLHGDAPQYLRQFTPIADIPCRQRLQSFSSDDLLVPAVRLPTVGRRAFLVAGARIWNDLRSADGHLSTISSHLRKTTKTASVSTFLPWPSFINQLFLCVVLVIAACYLGHLKNFLIPTSHAPS